MKQEGNSNIDCIPHAVKPKSAHARGWNGGPEPKSAHAQGGGVLSQKVLG